MKNFSQIFVGISVGILASALMIGNTAFGEDENSFWNEVVSSADALNWSDVFGVNGGDDIYLLVYKKTLINADKEALDDVAHNMGLTPDEAQAVLDGSLTPLYNSPNRPSAEFTQEDALKALSTMRSNYNDLKELYQIQQEVELAVQPSEIFANGDLSDSGFDLVYELNLIEEILFAENTPVTVGAVYKDALKSPINPTEDQPNTEQFVGSETPIAIDRLSLTNDAEGNLSASLAVDGEDVPVEVLDEDICSLDNAADAAVKEFDQNKAAGIDSNGGLGGSAEGANGDVAAPAAEEAGSDNVLVAAPADQWGQPWCPGFETNDSRKVDNFSDEKFGQFLDNFTSIAGGSTAPLFAGASSDYRNEYLQANVAVCLSVNLARQVYTSFNPGETCIECEVEQINDFLDKTLTHSLIPNKATGNLLESAKCKDSKYVNAGLLNFQFITIWNPIPTPPNDQLIFGNNIFEEWNNFTKRYQPILEQELSFDIDASPEPSSDDYLDFYGRNAAGQANQQEVLNDLRKAQNAAEAEAVEAVKAYELGETVSNQALTYDRNVLAEMQQMNNLMKAFSDVFGKIDSDALQAIKAKPDL